MLSLLNAFILHALASMTSAKPYHPIALRPRTNSSVAPLTPGIEATITSPAGDDVTSSFQILLYESPKEATSNLTDRQVDLMRPLNFCWSGTQTFSHSHCNYHYRLSYAKPLQHYIIYCRVNNPDPNDTRTRIISQPGSCMNDEICVDGAGGLDRKNHDTVAKCVSRSYFKPILREHTEEEGRKFMKDLKAMTAVALLTQTDGTTPLSVNKLELDAGVAEEGEEGVHNNQSCTNCFTLATSKFREGTDFLKTQATLAAVGAATAGMMFLAVMSG